MLQSSQDLPGVVTVAPEVVFNCCDEFQLSSLSDCERVLKQLHFQALLIEVGAEGTALLSSNGVEETASHEFAASKVL
jgi:hypothetical protein